jgi:hypothetical protein
MGLARGKLINLCLKKQRDLIRSMPPCAARDAFQSQFDKTLARIEEIRPRIMLQWDAGTIATAAELDDVFVAELLRVIDLGCKELEEIEIANRPQ